MQEPEGHTRDLLFNTHQDARLGTSIDDDCQVDHVPTTQIGFRITRSNRNSNIILCDARFRAPCCMVYVVLEGL